MALDDVRAELAGKLTAAGYTTALDPRALVLPGVLVGIPPTITRATRCVCRFEIPVYVVAAPPGDGAAVAWLLAAVPAVMVAVDAMTATVDTVDAAGQTGLPAYLVPVPVTADLGE